MTDDAAVVPTRRPLPGTGRLGVASAYFTVMWVVGGVASVQVTRDVASSLLHGDPTLMKRNAASGIFALIGMTVSAFATSRLLDRRSRLGALTALIWFALDAASYLAGARGPSSPGFSLLGILVVGSVWRHLE